MKKSFAIFLAGIVCSLFSFEATASPLAADTVRISKIRLSIDDLEYVVNYAGVKAEKAAGEIAKVDLPALRPETILSFLGVIPGDMVSLADLPVKCREAELRITQSGLVYETVVMVAPHRNDSPERTLIVSAKSGFLYRFGGGNAFGVVGKDAIAGGRNSLRIYAGWNRTGARYIDYRVAGLPLALGGGVTWFGPGTSGAMSGVTGSAVEGLPVELIATVGFLPHPDVIVGIDTAYAVNDFGGGSGNVCSVQPFIQYRRYLVSRSEPEADMVNDAGADLRAFLFPAMETAKGEVSGFIHCRILPDTMVAMKGAGGMSLGAVSFDLLRAEDRSVRSGYTGEELRASSFAFASVELRQQIFAIRIPPGFDCTAQAFGFCDTAVLNRSMESAGKTATEFVDAYGLGLRILFDNPVFAYFSFSYGINHEGSSRFMFCGTAGF
jgi:hypothetical protein